jgi:hypothetical protein
VDIFGRSRCDRDRCDCRAIDFSRTPSAEKCNRRVAHSRRDHGGNERGDPLGNSTDRGSIGRGEQRDDRGVRIPGKIGRDEIGTRSRVDVARKTAGLRTLRSISPRRRTCHTPIGHRRTEFRGCRASRRCRSRTSVLLANSHCRCVDARPRIQRSASRSAIRAEEARHRDSLARVRLLAARTCIGPSENCTRDLDRRTWCRPQLRIRSPGIPCWASMVDRARAVARSIDRFRNR